MAKSNLDYYWEELLKLKPGDRLGNSRCAVFCYQEYMLVETKRGSKRTSCLDAARFLASRIEFKDIVELDAEEANLYQAIENLMNKEK